MKFKSYIVMKIVEVVFVISILILCLSFASNAQVQPSKLFSNGMVLQRDTDIKIWGTGTSGATVLVTLNGTENSTIIDSNGKWVVVLNPMVAGGPFQMVITSGSQILTYNDVYIGDVWIASGQSNMELTVSQSDNSATEIASANNQLIRQFKIPKILADNPSDIVPSGSTWSPATAANVGNFSAAAYFFAKALFNHINIPIGIINTSYGGSRIEAWMSKELLGYDESEVILAGGTYRERQPTTCYNQMLKPLEGLPVKGFIWYQGESNADNMEDALEYGSLFKTMITGWRQAWGMGNLPFIWVQLPNFGEIYNNPNEWDAWPQLRANQTRALALPNTGEAVTIDIGDVDIHPTHKQPVGERLALVARKIAYNEDIVYSGPRYKSHQLLSNGKVVIKFDHTGSGLRANNATSGSVTGFAVANNNNTLSWADAILDGDSVIVWNNAVPNPTIIRYAWEYNPACNLFNAENLPAAPFKINVSDPGFSVKYFNASATTIERGQSSILSWESYGAANITLNDQQVDSIAAKRVIPEETTTYTLNLTNRNDTESTIIRSVTITVVDPKPTISIRTDVGGIASPGTQITLIADVTAPKGRTISKVDFYIDDILVGTDNQSPYQINWTPSVAGNFSFTAKVTDNSDVSVLSAPSIIYITNLKMLIYEAENATWTGTGSVKGNSQVSNKKYLDMNSNGWVITFDNVEVPESGEYPLSIRYLLNYESPKAQILIVNDKSLGEITFSAPNTTTWSTYVQNVSLNKGKNKIQIDDSWGWMSFDYISIAVEDTSTTGATGFLNQNKMKLNTFPNPVKNKGNINYFVPEESKVNIDIYSATGVKIKTLVNEKMQEGFHSINFDATRFNPGIYVARMKINADSYSQQFVIIE